MVAFTREQLYRDVCEFLGEGYTAPGATTPLAVRILGQEPAAAELLLARSGWNFASECRALTLVATADPEVVDSDPIGWGYAYSRGDVAKINWVSTSGRETDRLVSGRQWAEKGGRILSNHNPLYLDGVQRRFGSVSNYGYWTFPFGRACGSVIADMLSQSVTGSRGRAADVSQRSEALIQEAIVHDAQNAPPPVRRHGSWLRSRWTRSRRAGEEL